MGKRSPGQFERKPQDLTPRRLMPWLRGIRTFAEPCHGYSDLARYLESHGLRCVYRRDIRTGQDALEVDAYNDADVIITNPPYSRELMHPLILHFQHIARLGC
jgi:hypothetical protein